MESLLNRSFRGLTSLMENALDEFMNTIKDEEVAESRNGPDCENVLESLDPSVPHDIYVFMLKLVEDKARAKRLFLSYNKIVERNKAMEFKMTKEQNLHARSILQAIPGVDQIRFELSPKFMPDSRFWQIYFTLIDEKSSIGAPKSDDDDDDADDIEERQDEEHVERPNSSFLSEEKEQVETKEDIHKGVKRERDDVSDVIDPQDMAIVSRLLYGAKKTLQIAEKLIEAVDERASQAAMSEPEEQEPCNEKEEEEEEEEDEENSDEQIQGTRLLTKDGTTPLVVERNNYETGSDTDGISVSSAEDEWTRVTPKSANKKMVKDDDDGEYQLV